MGIRLREDVGQHELEQLPLHNSAVRIEADTMELKAGEDSGSKSRSRSQSPRQQEPEELPPGNSVKSEAYADKKTQHDHEHERHDHPRTTGCGGEPKRQGRVRHPLGLPCPRVPRKRHVESCGCRIAHGSDPIGVLDKEK